MISDEFSKIYKNLNQKQKEAVDTIEGPVMVVAGPGTGKTTILTLRIANILRLTDTPPNGILAITYTDAGVKAMRNKLRAIIGNRAHDVEIHTFHSFASKVISEYPDHFIRTDGMKVLTEIDQESIINSILKDPAFAKLRPSGKPDFYTVGIIRAIDEAKREAITPEEVKKFANTEIKRITNDESSVSTRGATKGQLKADAREMIEKSKRTILLAEIYDRYEIKKWEMKRLDYNDLIIELLTALRRDELLLRLIQERFLYLHVDEHQDTNDAQNFIVALIAEFFETPNLFIVGDEKQAIYRFQGASVENFLLLQKRYPSMKTISLGHNYRSHQSILDAAFQMVENNYEKDEYENLRIKLKSGLAKKAAPIDVISAANAGAADIYLINEIRRIIEKTGKSIAIIVRRNRELDRIIRLLESENIPVSSERSVDIFNHPIGRLFFDLAEYLNNQNQESLAKTIIAGMWNLPFEKGVKLVKALSSGQKVNFEKELPKLNELKMEMLGDNPLSFIINAASKSGFSKLIAKDPSYVYVWRGIVALAEGLARENEFDDPAKLLETMLKYKESAESRPVKVTVGGPESQVKALTAHGSKGLEFDYVFLPYATEEAWIGKPRGSSFVLPQKKSSQNDIRDTRRLFYVGLTRARDHVVILTPLEESDGKALSPLRFIAELDKKNVRNIDLPAASAEELEKREARTPEDLRGSKIIDIAKHTLIENGLSVTALNHFLECPNKFIYQSVLKMPQAPSPLSEKGSAMHEAMRRAWKLKKRDASLLEKTIKKSISDYLADSFLSAYDKAAVERELMQKAPEVAAALTLHFKKEGKVLTEHWVKTVFNGSFKNKKIEIPLHGKLDAILENDDRIEVFDYKTRQALSEAAIKGETKNDSGNYFRQLIFYKLLLESNPRWREKKIIPALVFISPDKKGRCPTITLPINDKDLSKVKSEIQSLIDAVWSGEIAKAKCSDPKCEWCGLRKI